MVAHELAARILKVRLVAVDNDGVMTDGRIVLGDYGDELKFFDVQDGFGLVLLRRAGLTTVMISGKKSKVNPRRAKEVHFVKIYQNVFDKLKLFEKMARAFRVKPDEVCYIGDDLIDIPVMSRVGFAVAPANALPEAKSAAHYVTTREGGRGAVREVADMILKTQGKWAEVTKKYFQ